MRLNVKCLMSQNYSSNINASTNTNYINNNRHNIIITISTVQ